MTICNGNATFASLIALLYDIVCWVTKRLRPVGLALKNVVPTLDFFLPPVRIASFQAFRCSLSCLALSTLTLGARRLCR